jgi:hypothetical protein
MTHTCPVRPRLTVRSRWDVGRGVGPIALEGESAWLARPGAGQIIHITVAGRSVIHLGGVPASLAVGPHRLWVAERDGDEVVSIGTRSLAVATRSRVPVPVSVNVGPFGVWALSIDTASLYRIDPLDGVSATPVDSPVADPVDMVAVGEEQWVLGAGEQGLSPVNARLSRVVRAGFDRPGHALSGLSAAGSTIWLAEPGTMTLLRVDSSSVSVRQIHAPAGIRPSATAVGPCGLWVADRKGDLAIVDPQTGAPLAPLLHVGRSVAALAVSGSELWLTDPVDGTLVRVGLETRPSPAQEQSAVRSPSSTKIAAGAQSRHAKSAVPARVARSH